MTIFDQYLALSEKRLQSSSSRMCAMNHNWSATKQHLHLQSVAAGAAQRLQRWGVQITASEASRKIFCCTPQKGVQISFCAIQQGVQNHCKNYPQTSTKVHHMVSQYKFHQLQPTEPLYCDILLRHQVLANFQVLSHFLKAYTSQIMAHRRTLTSDPALLLHVLNNK